MGDKQTFEIILRARDELTKVLKGIGPETIRSAREGAKGLNLIDRALERVRKEAGRALGFLGRGLRGIGSTIRRFVTPGLGQLLLVGSAIGGIVGLTSAASNFSEAIAEVSTLVDTSTVSIEALSDETLNLAKTFGLRELDVAKSQYQAISSGAVDAAHSTELLTQAAKLSIAGVAELTPTVDVLTDIINAYKLQVEEAERVSDVLFTTVRLGKTTIPELANNLGNVIPIAAQLGVSIEEVGAAIAQITAGGGGGTAEATTQLAAVLRGLLQQFDQIKKALPDFTPTTVSAEGLVPVLQRIRNAAGSDEKILEILGARAERLLGVLNLTGPNLDAYTGKLDEMGRAAGATGDALEKQLTNEAKRAGIALNAIRIQAVRDIGAEFLTAAVDAIEMAGGVERLSANIGVATKTAGIFFSSFLRGAGRALQELDSFIEGIGGVERVTEVAGAAAEVAGAAVEIAFAGAARTIRAFVEVLALIPGAISKGTNPAKFFTQTKGAFREAIELETERLFAAEQAVDDAMREFFAAVAERRRTGHEIPEDLFLNLNRNIDAARARVIDIEAEIVSLNRKLAEAPAGPTELRAEFDRIFESLGEGGAVSEAEERLRDARARLEGILTSGEGRPRPPEWLVLSLKAAVKVAEVTGERIRDELLAGLSPSFTRFVETGANMAVRAIGENFESVMDRVRLLTAEPLTIEVEFAKGELPEFDPIPPPEQPDIFGPRTEEARKRRFDAFALEIELAGQVTLSIEDQLDVEEKIAEIRRASILDRAFALGKTGEDLRGIVEQLDRIDQQSVDDLLGFKGVDQEVANLTRGLDQTVEAQQRAVEAAAEGQRARIALLAEMGRITEAERKALLDLVDAVEASGKSAAIAKTEFDRLGEGIGNDLTAQLGGVIARTRDTSEAWNQMLRSMAEKAGAFVADSVLDDLLGSTDLGSFLGFGRETGKEIQQVDQAAGAAEAAAALQTGGDLTSAALTTGGTVTAQTIETGGNLASTALEGGGLLVASAMEGGAATSATTLEGGGILAAAAMVAGAKTSAGILAAAGIGGSAGGAAGGPTGALAAQGAIIPGGLGPLLALAGGGVVTGPHFALIGEGRGAGGGKQDEAVVPLTANRAIPVEMRGGGGTTHYETHNWYVDAVDQQSFDSALLRSHKTVRRIGRADARESNEMRQTVRRAARTL